MPSPNLVSSLTAHVRFDVRFFLRFYVIHLPFLAVLAFA